MMVTVTPAQTEVMSTPVPLINCPISPHVIGAPPRCVFTPSKKRPREKNPMHTYFWTPYAGTKYTTSHKQAVSRIPVYRTVEGSGKPWLSLLGECPESVVIERWGGENGGYERVSGYQPIPRFLTKQEYVRTRGMFRMH